MKSFVALLSGLLFSLGLCVSGMTRPSKILAFLDVAGAWDPSLALVMAGAVGVSALAFRAARRRAPVLEERYHLPPVGAVVDRRLVLGSALFGVGWGLSGLCPGPAVVCLVSGQVGVLVFVGAMLVGMAVVRG